jgi:hypothetical protein
MDKKKRRLILGAVLIFALVQGYNSCRSRNYLTRSALLLPALSPWQRLLNFGDDKSFLLMTGMTRAAFVLLDRAIFPFESTMPIVGRPSSLDSRGQLGLFLFYIGSKMGTKHLCTIFGITPSCSSRFVNDLLRLVVKRLLVNEHAKIEFPSKEKMELFAAMIGNRENMASDVIGFMDGLSLSTQCSSTPDIQNSFYNGYHSDTMVNNVLAFGPDGKVFIAAINYPGSWHDGAITMDIIEFLHEHLNGKKICVDQGFPRSGRALDILVGPYSEKSARKLSPILRSFLLILAAVYTSLRQASEWGMRGLQGTFPRLCCRLPSSRKKRYRIILSIILIHNFRTELVGLNRIATVFNPEYQLHKVYEFMCLCEFRQSPNILDM